MTIREHHWVNVGFTSFTEACYNCGLLKSDFNKNPFANLLCRCEDDKKSKGTEFDDVFECLDEEILL